MRALLATLLLLWAMPPHEASALAFRFEYDARITESILPNFPVGLVIPGNVIEVTASHPATGGDDELIDEGTWIFAGAFTIDLTGMTFREPSGEDWRTDFGFRCSVCVPIFGVRDFFIEIALAPGNGDRLPPIPFTSGVQTIHLIGDLGPVATVVATLIPEPSIALLLTSGSIALGTRRRCQRERSPSAAG